MAIVKIILFFIPENLPIFLDRMIDKISISGPLLSLFLDFLKHPRMGSPIFFIAVYGGKVKKDVAFSAR